MIPTRCTVSTWDHCPAGGLHRGKRTRPPRLRGQMHPNPEPWAGLTVGDVAERLPAGGLVAMRDLLGDVRLVCPRRPRAVPGDDRAKRRVPARTPHQAQRSPAPHTATRLNPEHPRVAARRCGKCGLRPPGPGGVLCPACRLMLEGRPARAGTAVRRISGHDLRQPREPATDTDPRC
jgi:hypothetical protein